MGVEIIRLENSEQYGMFGIMKIDGAVYYTTLELPWKANKPFISCIPAGKYMCKKYISVDHGHTYKITDVPGRSDIIIHSGNTLKDTSGCIILGMMFGEVNHQRGVLLSKKAMDAFRAKMYWVHEFELIIKEVFI